MTQALSAERRVNATWDLLSSSPFWQRDSVEKNLPWMAALIVACAEESERIEKQLVSLLDNCRPQTTSTLLPEWERVFGLPDACARLSVFSQDSRALSLRAFWQSRRPLTLKQAELLAKIYGSPFEVKKNNVKDVEVRIGSGHSPKHFRCGSSRCGEKLLAFMGFNELGCRLTENAPAGIKFTITADL